MPKKSHSLIETARGNLGGFVSTLLQVRIQRINKHKIVCKL